MALPRTILTGIVLSVVFAVLGVLLFFQTADPLVLLAFATPTALAWAVVLVVHVLLHGFPVRVIHEK